MTTKNFEDDSTLGLSYVAKAGIRKLEIRDDTFSLIAEGDMADFRDSYFGELFRVLEASPHVMDISPDKETFLSLIEDDKKFPYPLRIQPYSHSISFSPFICLRVVLPKRKRKGLSSLSWNPEEFHIFFNGALFFAIGQVPHVPIYTDIGQIARDFLTETLENSQMWSASNVIPPTPIHPDFFFVFSQEVETILLEPSRSTSQGLLVSIPESISYDEFIEDFLFRIEMPLNSFYDACFYQQQISDGIRLLEQENLLLSEKLSDYFDSNPIRRCAERRPGKIRKILGIIHLLLYQLASHEVTFTELRKKAQGQVEDSFILNEIEDYFDEYLEPEKYDRNALITTMNFAAEETSNATIVYATMVSALIGATVGGLIALLAQL